MDESSRDAADPTVRDAYNAVLPRRRLRPERPPVELDAERSTQTSPASPADTTRYELIDRPEPKPVPNGWYALCASDGLRPGDVTTVVAVERELVAYRTTSGEVRVVDSHCPHLGAHLGGGHVEGDTLACPYHGWRFGADGACVEIPYSESRIPARACVPSYPVRERNGMVLFWFHAGGAAPDYEVPDVDESDDAAWTPARTYRQEFVASLQEMAENNVDYTHFHFVHQRDALDESTSVFSTDGPFSTVEEDFGGGFRFTRYTYGPGIALLRVPGVMTVLTATTPIDRRHCRLLWHFHVPVGQADSVEELVEGVTGEFGLQADVPIWRDKVYRERPLLVKGDGPVAEFRRWYSQFYSGR